MERIFYSTLFGEEISVFDSNSWLQMSNCLFVCKCKMLVGLFKSHPPISFKEEKVCQNVGFDFLGEKTF